MFHNCTIEQLLFWLKGTVGTQFGTRAPRKASTTLLVARYIFNIMKVKYSANYRAHVV